MALTEYEKVIDALKICESWGLSVSDSFDLIAARHGKPWDAPDRIRSFDFWLKVLFPAGTLWMTTPGGCNQTAVDFLKFGDIDDWDYLEDYLSAQAAGL